MAITDIKFPYNPLGDREDCKIVDEFAYLTMTNGVDYQCIIPECSPFFAKGLTVESVNENKMLQINIDYILTYKFKKAEEVLNQEIYGSITFLDKNLTGKIKLSYSTLGGDFTNNDNVVLERLVANLTGHRTVDWEDILNKPVTFPPSQHTHTPDQVMDMNDGILPLEKIAELIRGDTHPDHHHTIDKIDGLTEALASKVSNDKNVVFAPINPFIINNMGSVLIIQLPKVLSATAMKFSLWITDNNINSIITVMGVLEPDKNENDPWIVLNVRADNIKISNRVAGAYSNDGSPLFYLKKVEGIWDNIVIVIPIIEYTKNVVGNISGEFKCLDGTTLVGKIIDIDRYVYQSQWQIVQDRLHRVKINTIIGETIYDVI